MLKLSAATKAVADRLSDDDMALASLGFAKYELYGKAPNHARSFFMWNSMGMASSMGLGMAMAQPDKRMVVLQGDGDLLMNLNSLATEANRQPKNLIHICWDNRMFQITGKQPTASGGRTDLSKVAVGAGFDPEKVIQVETLDAFNQALDKAWNADGPWFIHALMEIEDPPTTRPPKSATLIKHRFMEHLGVEH